MKATADEADVFYPTGDGEPMAETPIHVQAIILLHQALEDLLLPLDPDVFIASDIFWYYQKGRRNRRVAPDVMVVPGAGPAERRAFFSWRETVPTPGAVFEMASRSTWNDDLDKKYKLYQRLQVPEYYVFDPEGRYVVKQLLGYRLRNGKYSPMRRVNGALVSGLGFRLRAEGELLRLFDANGVAVPTRAEAMATARQLADEQKQRADGLQSEVERLKALLKQYGHANGTGP